jgi:hypothetical protein
MGAGPVGGTETFDAGAESCILYVSLDAAVNASVLFLHVRQAERVMVPDG